MSTFVPYPKIVDSLAAWDVDDADRRALDRGVWVASEKVHGANLCIGSDGTAIEVAKRRAVLAPGEPFFAHERALGPLVAGVRRLARALDAAWVLIYGELFGGHYPHPAVASVDGVAPVQTGVYYAPDIRFCLNRSQCFSRGPPTSTWPRLCRRSRPPSSTEIPALAPSSFSSTTQNAPRSSSSGTCVRSWSPACSLLPARWGVRG